MQDRNGPILWKKLRDLNGHWWRLYLSSGEHHKEFHHVNGNAAGLTFLDDRDIFVDSLPPQSEQDETVLHELLHAAFQAAKWHPKNEERLIRKLSPQLFSLLKGIGFKLPARPGGVSRMRKRSRRV